MTGPGEQLFTLESVSVARGGRTVLHQVDLEVAGPGPTVIAGPSGSGKSSLLRLLNRLDAPATGTIRFCGRDLADTDPTVLRRQVAMVFQKPVALPGTVADNLREADPALADADVDRALRSVGLDPTHRDRPATELSGGETQRLGLARSLATNPQVVLFDEPTANLDPAASARIEALAVGLADRQIAVVWVTHDLDQLRRLARHLVIVVDGHVVQAGTAHDVLARPEPQVARFLTGGER